MNILVLNSGSSSIKFSIYETQPSADPTPILDAELSGIGTDAAKIKQGDGARNVTASSEEEAVQLVLDEISKAGTPEIHAVGYRVVHPGPKIDRHVRIDDAVLEQLEAAIDFAPLHLPEALKLIRKVMQHLPEIPHFACFDTIFHQTIPYQTALYAIPLAFHDQGVRKYGFHGLSCESVVRQLHAAGINPTRMIIAHLGSGCSVTALVDGKSVDNSMGLTPTGGLVMGTRPGDLDPGLVFYLLRQPGATIDSVEHMLNHESGLKAIGGVNDMRKLEEDLGQGEQHAKDGVAIFRQSLRRTLGGMVAVHGMDALVFTGGIGEHDQDIHSTGRALVGNEPMIESAPGTQQGVRTISSTASALPVYVVPADEDLMIALHVRQLYASNHS